jgi:hypothetical protein
LLRGRVASILPIAGMAVQRMRTHATWSKPVMGKKFEVIK